MLTRQLGTTGPHVSAIGLGCMGMSDLYGPADEVELLVVLELRGLSIAEYVRTRDPLSGGVYLLMLGLFALMPWVVSRRRGASMRRS